MLTLDGTLHTCEDWPLSQTAVCERGTVPLHMRSLLAQFFLSEHSLETKSLICYCCAEF